MSHKRRHWIEKFQVQLAAGGALALVYFALWRLMRPVDPLGPIVFLPAPEANVGSLFILAALVTVLAAACAVLTISARPEGALLAALVGAGGLSLRSPSILTLLWLQEDDLRGLYGTLLIETLLLTAAIAVAAAAVDVARYMVWRFRPRWMWANPLARAAEANADLPAAAPRQAYLLGPVVEAVTGLFALRGRAARTHRGLTGRVEELTRGATHLVLGLVIASVLLLVLLQSTDRGQVIFAVFVSFALGAGVAHQFFPTRHGTLAWCMPAIAAVAYYTMAMAAAVGADHAWMDMPNYAYILPVDWMTAGGGGAVMGYWMSARVHETRHFEDLEKQEKA